MVRIQWAHQVQTHHPAPSLSLHLSHAVAKLVDFSKCTLIHWQDAFGQYKTFYWSHIQTNLPKNDVIVPLETLIEHRQMLDPSRRNRLAPRLTFYTIPPYLCDILSLLVTLYRFLQSIYEFFIVCVKHEFAFGRYSYLKI